MLCLEDDRKGRVGNIGWMGQLSIFCEKGKEGISKVLSISILILSFHSQSKLHGTGYMVV